MAKRYWLQYHNFEVNGPPGFAGINTNKDDFLSRIDWGKRQDMILLMLGLLPTKAKLIECGLPLTILDKAQRGQKLYLLWEKFLAEDYDYIGESYYGGFNYVIIGDENDCVDYRDNPILFQSPEFKEFWHSYNRHGLICLSDSGVPFPELADIGEGLVYRPSRISQGSNLNISGKVSVSQEVWQGIEFIRNRLPKHQLVNLPEVYSTLNRYGYSITTDWIKKHSQEYLGGWRFGFEVQQKAE